MWKLADIGKTTGTRTATLRGKDITLRGLSANETLAIDALVPAPRMMTRIDPKGETVPDPDNDLYVAARERVGLRRTVLTVAAASGYETGTGMKWDLALDNGPWAKEVEKELLGVLSEREIFMLAAEVNAACQPSATEARGNSSAPLAAGQPQPPTSPIATP